MLELEAGLAPLAQVSSGRVGWTINLIFEGSVLWKILVVSWFSNFCAELVRTCTI